MKILVVGKFYKEGFGSHIAETLNQMGHVTFQYDPGLKFNQAKGKLSYRVRQIKTIFYELYSKTDNHRRRTARHLASLVSINQPELVICCHDFLTPAQVSIIKSNAQTKVALWFPDAISNFHKAMFLDADYDFLFFKEPFIVKILRNEYGKPAYYLPECCNPEYHRPIKLSSEEKEKYACDITTAGNLHTARSSLFKMLTRYNVKIWGNPAPRWMDTTGIKRMIQNKYVSNEDKAKAFLAAKVVLNNVYPTEIFGGNVRVFEISGCSAFQICSWRPAIAELCKEDEEIVFYRSVEDLKSKPDFYLANQQIRDQIAKKAYLRTITEHTYKHRLQLMIDTVFQNAEGFQLFNHSLC